MSVALVGVAAIAIIGAVATVSARDARLALTGLTIALVAATFVADPLPDVRVVALRVVGGVLAARLLWPAVRSGMVQEGGSLLGWRAEAFLAVAAATCGWVIAANLAGAPLGTELPPEIVPAPPFDATIVRFAAPAAAGLAIVAALVAVAAGVAALSRTLDSDEVAASRRAPPPESADDAEPSTSGRAVRVRKR